MRSLFSILAVCALITHLALASNNPSNNNPSKRKLDSKEQELQPERFGMRVTPDIFHGIVHTLTENGEANHQNHFHTIPPPLQNNENQIRVLQRIDPLVQNYQQHHIGPVQHPKLRPYGEYEYVDSMNHNNIPKFNAYEAYKEMALIRDSVLKDLSGNSIPWQHIKHLECTPMTRLGNPYDKNVNYHVGCVSKLPIPKPYSVPMNVLLSHVYYDWNGNQANGVNYLNDEGKYSVAQSNSFMKGTGSKILFWMQQSLGFFSRNHVEVTLAVDDDSLVYQQSNLVAPWTMNRDKKILL